jgi:hypothetical protein
MIPSPRGPSKQHTNLVIWSRPRVNTFHCLCLSLHFLPLISSLSSSLQYLLVSLAVICNRKYPSESSSCQVQLQLYLRLHRLQLSSTNFQVQLLAVLQDFSGFNCLLPCFKFNCYLYFRDCRLQLSSSIFSSSIITVLPDYSGYKCFLRLIKSSSEVYFFGFLFVYQHLKYLA